MLCLLQNLMTALIPPVCELTFSKHFVTPKPLPTKFWRTCPYKLGWSGDKDRNISQCFGIRPFSEAFSVPLWTGMLERSQSCLYKHLKKIQWSLFKGKELEHLQNYGFKNAYKYHASLLSNFTHLLSLKTVIDFTTKNLIHNFYTDFCLFVRFCFCVCPLPTINMAAVNDQLI